MASLVIYGNEFPGQIDNGLAPESFKYRFLVEGDSWMDRSAMFHTSLLQSLAPEMDAGHESALFINIAMFGDTMRRMGQGSNADFVQWINTSFRWKFDGLLLSAGGNDFIDAARDPDAGKGILKNLAGQPVPAQGRDCLNPTAVAELVNDWLNPNFTAMYKVVQSSGLKNMPIFLNSYDTPTARDAPVFKDGRSWLCDSYKKNQIPPALWPDLTDAIFKAVIDTMNGWAAGRNNVHVVPTTGKLIPAQHGTTESDGDWLNEIHPNRAGWKNLAKVWRASINQVLP
jgi:hypothetical protein